MIVKLRAWGYCSLLGGLVACGGISRVDRSGPQSAAAGSGGQSGSDGAGSAAAGRAAAGGSLGDLAACAPFKDQPPEPVTVRIRNDTTFSVYLGPRTAVCGSSPLFVVYINYGDNGLPDQPQPATCRMACQRYFDGEASDSCGGACAPSNVVKLGPGETVVTEWSGLVDLDSWAPSACDGVSGSKWGFSCKVATRESPAGYGFRVEAGTAVVCADGSTGCTDCVPDTRGGCRISGATISGHSVFGNAYFELDERDGLTGPGADSTGGHPVRTLEVVVKDGP